MPDLRQRLLALYATPRNHRILPAFLAVWLAGYLEPVARRLRNPQEAVEAQRLMSDLLQFTPRAHETRQATRRHLRERSMMRELMWRPWLLRWARIDGAHALDEARDGGLGCVVVIAHIGASWAVSGIFGRYGYDDVHVVASAHYFDDLPDDLVGRTHRHLHQTYAMDALGPDRVHSNTAPPERLTELIRAGDTVAIAFDVPGSTATPFLGRSVALASGPASLAFQTGAKVVPVIARRSGVRLRLQILTPIEPTDYRDLPSLRAAIARAYEPILLKNPEIIENAWYPSPLVTEALSAPPPSSTSEQ